MEYKENALYYEDYCKLRESVGWLLFPKEQTQKALNNSLYTVIAVDNNQTIGMGRLVDKTTPVGGRSSIQLIAEKGKETFYEKMGFKMIPHEFCGSGMRRVIHK